MIDRIRMMGAFGLALGLALMGAPVQAQETQVQETETQQVPASTAAATLPNSFDRPASSRPQARPAPVPEATTAEAPDIVRGRETLVAFIADAQDGKLDFSVFSDNVAASLRPAEAEITAAIQGYGEIQDVTYVSHQNGADLYTVRFETVLTQWVIGFDADDQVAVLLFREAPDEDDAP